MTAPTPSPDSVEEIARRLADEIALHGLWQASCEGCGTTAWLDLDATTKIVLAALAAERQRADVSYRNMVEALERAEAAEARVAALEQALKTVRDMLWGRLPRAVGQAGLAKILNAALAPPPQAAPLGIYCSRCGREGLTKESTCAEADGILPSPQAAPPEPA